MLIKKLAKQYNIRVIYKNYKQSGGVFSSKSLIILSTNIKKEDLLSVFLHEVGHIIAYRQNKYKVYHSDINPNRMNKKNKHIFKSTAYAAELWADKWAEKEFIKLRLKGTFQKNYGIDPDQDKQFLKTWYFG